MAVVLLLVYALITATVAPRLLQRAHWPTQSPALGILAWQVLSASTGVSVVLAGLVLAVPALPLHVDLADFLHMCTTALQQQYSTANGRLAGLAGVGLAGGVTVRWAWCLALACRKSQRLRADQERMVRLVADETAGGAGVVVIEHPSCSVYCLPGRAGLVVMTSAALRRLDSHQLVAVLAHERLHLRARHDLVLTAAEAAHRAFPGVPVFAAARAELVWLVEMHADDAAIEQTSPRALATAMVELASGVLPRGGLGAATAAVLARINRLGDGTVRVPPVLVGLLVVGMSAMLLGPLAAVAAPVLSTTAAQLCPVGATL